MRLGGLHAHAEHGGNLAHRLAFGDELQHLPFPIGQRIGAWAILLQAIVDEGARNARAQIHIVADEAAALRHSPQDSSRPGVRSNRLAYYCAQTHDIIN